MSIPYRCSRLVVSIVAVIFFPLSGMGETRLLANQIPGPVASGAARAFGRYSPSAHVEVAIGLPLRDKAGLEAFLDALYNPASPTYKQYLTPEQFAERFGATAADYRRVLDFVSSQGLTVTATSPNRMIVDVGGSVADFERTFRFTMLTYPHPAGDLIFHAPDVQPSVPNDVPIQDILGLDDYAPPRRMNAGRRHTNVGSAVERPEATSGSGVGGSFKAEDLQAAYTPKVTLNGAGQSVGLYETQAYPHSDILAYEQATGLPNVPLVNVLLDGVSGVWTPGYGDGEIALDIDMAISLAPGLSQVLVYEGLNGLDILNRMATDNAAKQLSSSFGIGGATATLQQIVMQFAAQGQSFFFASGDGGAYAGDVPLFDGLPYVTAVGATVLMTNGPGGPWQSESAWPHSGGGYDAGFPIPSYQTSLSWTANMGSAKYRNFPDVSAVGANLFWVAAGVPGGVDGTSASTPLWASFTALVNQQAALSGKPPVGFLNPAIYALGQSSKYTADFHDITDGNTTNQRSPNLFYAVPGFDLATGWGTPTGQNLINDLAGSGSGSPGFSLSVAPYQISVNPGASGASTITVNPYGGFAGSVNLAVSGLPGGVNAAFAPATTSTSSTLTVTAPALVAPGTYLGTITATSGSLSQTIGMTLTVIAPVSPDFTISAAPSILTMRPGDTLKSVITIAPAGTFANSVALSVTGAPKGLTASFNPASTAASSALTLSADSTVAPGIYILSINALSGNLKHSSTVGIFVRDSATAPVPVDLSAYYNLTGIAADGLPITAPLGRCCAYSANLLGTSLTLNRIPAIFGPASNGLAPALNVVVPGSFATTIKLPAGQFASLHLVASGKTSTTENFTVDYADGTSATFSQNMSDWTSPQNNSGETIASQMSYSNSNVGAQVAGNVYLYDYEFNLDACEAVNDLAFPRDSSVVIVAVTLVPASTPCSQTAISSVNVVSGGADSISQNTISQNTWIELHGLDLAPSNVPANGMTWSNAPDFAQGKMPTQLDGVKVTVDGNPAYVYYISPGQIDVLTPLDSKTGSVSVVATNGTASSKPFAVNQTALSPALALVGSTSYLASTHADGTYVGPASLGPGFTPAVPGEEIVLYGFGFGLPGGGAITPGSSTQSGVLPFSPSIKVGGQTAQVAFAGLISPGLYQFNVIVPPSASNGDNAVTAVYNSAAISTAGLITVQPSR